MARPMANDPPFATLNHFTGDLGIPSESDSLRIGISHRQRNSTGRPVMSQSVESRMGAVAWAIRQRSVSHPRSSNRTCPIKASGSPVGFTEEHTAGPLEAGVRDAAGSVLH